MRVEQDKHQHNQQNDRTDLRAAFYGLYLRELGYSVEQAAALVIERYPSTGPRLERLVRPVVDPLQAESRHLSRFFADSRELGGLEERRLVSRDDPDARVDRER